MTVGSLAFAMLVAVVVVPALRRTTAFGHTPRLAVLAWLSVSLMVLASWALAGVAIVTMPHDEPLWDWLRSASVGATGWGTSVDVIRHVVAVALILPLARFGYFLGKVLVEARRDWERRRGALRMLGPHPAAAQDMAMVTSEMPLVYCMPGKPGVIVVTTAARDCLHDEQFEAVLEHERSHLVGHHHLLVAVATAIGLAGRRVWLFRNTEQFVRDLVEMRADDVAVRRFGAETVATAIGKLAVVAPPAPALGAAGTCVSTRILRMSDPPTTARRMFAGLQLCWLAGVGCVHLLYMVAVPVVAMLVGDTVVHASLHGLFGF